jgi:hypothetical protein
MSYLSNSAVAHKAIPLAPYRGLVFESFTRAIVGAPKKKARNNRPYRPHRPHQKQNTAEPKTSTVHQRGRRTIDRPQPSPIPSLISH